MLSPVGKRQYPLFFSNKADHSTEKFELAIWVVRAQRISSLERFWIEWKWVDRSNRSDCTYIGTDSRYNDHFFHSYHQEKQPRVLCETQQLQAIIIFVITLRLLNSRYSLRGHESFVITLQSRKFHSCLVFIKFSFHYFVEVSKKPTSIHSSRPTCHPGLYSFRKAV